MTTSMIRGILVLFAAQAVLGQGDLVPEPKLVIKGGTLIDGTGRPPLANSVIVIEGDRITAVGEQGQVSIPPDARTIEAAGKFILPGLSDMHIHWQEWMPAGLFFAAIALFQLLWARLVLTRTTTPVLALGIMVNLAVIALWSVSRTAGAPLGPHAGQAELIQAADLCALLLQIYVVMEIYY